MGPGEKVRAPVQVKARLRSAQQLTAQELGMRWTEATPHAFPQGDLQWSPMFRHAPAACLALRRGCGTARHWHQALWHTGHWAQFSPAQCLACQWSISIMSSGLCLGTLQAIGDTLMGEKVSVRWQIKKKNKIKKKEISFPV